MTQKSLDIPSLCVSVSLSVSVSLCLLSLLSILSPSEFCSFSPFLSSSSGLFNYISCIFLLLSSFLLFTAAEPSVVLFGEASFLGFGLPSNKQASLVMGSKNFPILVVLGKTHMQTKSETHTHTHGHINAQFHTRMLYIACIFFC